jgi:hypothetical protein
MTDSIPYLVPTQFRNRFPPSPITRPKIPALVSSPKVNCDLLYSLLLITTITPVYSVQCTHQIKYMRRSKAPTSSDGLSCGHFNGYKFLGQG